MSWLINCRSNVWITHLIVLTGWLYSTNSPRGVGILDSQGKPLYANSRLRSLFNDDGDRLEIRYAPLSNTWRNFQSQFIKGTSRHEQILVGVPIKQKGTRWFAVRMTQNNKESHIIIFEDDVTEQHNRELQL